MTPTLYHASELAPGEAATVTVTDSTGKERRIALIRDTLGDLYAIDDSCTHADVSLAQGDIGQCTVECWAHSAVFDLKTGEGTLPATKSVRVYPVEIRDDEIFVDIDSYL